MDGTPASRAAAIQAEMKALSEERWGRPPEIIAVTKTVSPGRIRALDGTGIRRLGENRVQELLAKIPELPAEYRFDMIGRLQINKVKHIIDKVAMIQSLDRMPLAQEIDRRAKQAGRVMPVLVQVNIGNEPQKGGVAAEELTSFVREAALLSGIRICGLMAVMPDLQDEEALRPYFREMRTRFDHLREEAVAGTDIHELSMGMSGDYRLAAEEGATHVRIGSALFGARA